MGQAGLSLGTRCRHAPRAGSTAPLGFGAPQERQEARRGEARSLGRPGSCHSLCTPPLGGGGLGPRLVGREAAHRGSRGLGAGRAELDGRCPAPRERPSLLPARPPQQCSCARPSLYSGREPRSPHSLGRIRRRCGAPTPAGGVRPQSPQGDLSAEWTRHSEALQPELRCVRAKRDWGSWEVLGWGLPCTLGRPGVEAGRGARRRRERRRAARDPRQVAPRSVSMSLLAVPFVRRCPHPSPPVHHVRRLDLAPLPRWVHAPRGAPARSLAERAGCGLSRRVLSLSPRRCESAAAVAGARGRRRGR